MLRSERAMLGSALTTAPPPNWDHSEQSKQARCGQIAKQGRNETAGGSEQDQSSWTWVQRTAV